MALGRLQYPMRPCSLTGDRGFLALTPFAGPAVLPFAADRDGSRQVANKYQCSAGRLWHSGTRHRAGRDYLRSPSRVIVAR